MRFADAPWWVAWALPDDRHHTDSVAPAVSLGARERVLTTSLVVGETWTFLRRKAGHGAAVAYLDRIGLLEGAALTVHRVTAKQEDRAWAWLRRHDERLYSFVDATSFAVMRDRRLREAIAFDQDFAAAGFFESRP